VILACITGPETCSKYMRTWPPVSSENNPIDELNVPAANKPEWSGQNERAEMMPIGRFQLR
jgi:hypothetical protein